MAKRRRVEILAAILDAAVRARGGARKTRIMYDANLSFSLLGKYLDETMNLGFLQHDDGAYVTTEAGLKFLEQYGRYSSRYSRLKKELDASKTNWETLEQMCRLTGNCGSADASPFDILDNGQKRAVKQAGT